MEDLWSPQVGMRGCGRLRRAKLIGEPLRHEGTVNSAVFSPDGNLWSPQVGIPARVWEAATGKAIGEPLRHEEAVNRAAFSLDGKFVVTVSEDDSARVYRWFSPVSDSPENIAAGIEQITCRKIARNSGPAWISPETPLSGSQFIESFDWFAKPARTRPIWPGAVQTVPEFIMREIQDARHSEKISNARNAFGQRLSDRPCASADSSRFGHGGGRQTNRGFPA